MQQIRRMIGVLGAAALSVALTACQTNRHQEETAAEPAPQQQEERPVVRRASYYQPTLSSGQTMAELAFPTGSPRTSAIILHQVMPGSAQRGENFVYEYHITNLTDVDLQNVALTQETANNLQYISSTPISGTGSTGSVVWSIGDLPANRTQVIRVTARADEIGRADNCVTVSYNNFLCASLPIVQPDLTVAKTATPRVIRCDEIVLTYRVCNPGTGTATNVVVADTLPEGLTVNGSRNVRRQFDAIAPGDCEEFQVIANAARTGEFSSQATATAAGDLSVNSEAPTTVVIEPVLAISADCTQEAYRDTDFRHSYTVSNTGNGPSENTVVVATLPSGAALTGTPAGAELQGSRLVWNLGTIAPGAERTVSFIANAANAGTYQSTASVNGECAVAASTDCATVVRGIPAILLEVIDIKDPVLVDTETTYRITVTNQGTAPDRDIVITAVLPPQQAFVGADGVTGHSWNPTTRTVTFSPLAVLADGAPPAVWTVTIRAEDVGDVRFSVSMDSENLQSSVDETEATNLYR